MNKNALKPNSSTGTQDLTQLLKIFDRLVDEGEIVLENAENMKFYGDESIWDACFCAEEAEAMVDQWSREVSYFLEDGFGNGRIVGSVAIVKFSDIEAQLRWLLVDPEVRGRGLGRRLVAEALDFCQKAGYSSVFLWTVDTLLIASKLYQSVGFKKTQDLTHELWGSVVTEVRYELALK